MLDSVRQKTTALRVKTSPRSSDGDHHVRLEKEALRLSRDKAEPGSTPCELIQQGAELIFVQRHIPGQ